jgi:hypothetical protein
VHWFVRDAGEPNGFGVDILEEEGPRLYDAAFLFFIRKCAWKT